jgi:hypothetical protein
VDYNELAKQAVEVLKTALPLAMQQVASGFSQQPGAKLYDWVARKFAGTEGQAILEQAASEPENQKRLDHLQVEIADLLRDNQEAVRELQALLSGARNVTGTQTAHATGTGAIINQVIGTGNEIKN